MQIGTRNRGCGVTSADINTCSKFAPGPELVSGLQIPTTVASWSVPAILDMAVGPCFTQIPRQILQTTNTNWAMMCARPVRQHRKHPVAWLESKPCESTLLTLSTKVCQISTCHQFAHSQGLPMARLYISTTDTKETAAPPASVLEMGVPRSE